MDNPQQIIGAYIRCVREERGLTLESLAARARISYQYLSGLENGKENFSIQVLESLAQALQMPINVLVRHAWEPVEARLAPRVHPEYFRRETPLPPGLTFPHLESALNRTQSIFHFINRNMMAEISRPLWGFIQGNNFSGLVSNILSDSMDACTPYKHNHHQRYPDLVRREPSGETGLEIKATTKVGKGGESHNGHGGWHMVVCYEISEEGIQFLHVMMAMLNSHSAHEPDWKYVGSQVNTTTGSRRTETYVTTSCGTTKLRDGTVYVDGARITWTRWRQDRIGEIPAHSIFFRQKETK